MKKSACIVCFLLLPTSLVAQVGPLVLPGDDVGEEHYGDPPPTPEGGQWLGIYIRGDSSWVRPVEVTLERREPTEPGEPGTHEYRVDPRGPVLLMVGVGQARVGPAQTVLGYTDHLSPASPPRKLRIGSTEYRLALESPGPCEGVVVLSNGSGTQRLYDATADTTFACDEPHFEVHWAGDLDADGRLDLLATFSSKYSYHPRRLYLSSAAAPGDLVGVVSLFER